MSKYFIIGKQYQSETHGNVRYMGIDEFMGESTYKFLAFELPERPYVYWTEQAIEHHIKQPSNKGASR